MDGTPTKQEEIIFRSKLPDIPIPNHLPLHSYCFENISKFRNKPCLIIGATNQVFTYEEVELTSRKLASGLNKLGIKKGDTIMLLLPNSPEFVFAFLAASYIGANSTAANPFFTQSEILKQAEASNTKLIITQASHVEKFHDYALEKEVKIICIDSPPEGCLPFAELTAGDDHSFPDVEIDTEEDMVALLYSSGTTGLPKGAMLTHKSIVTNVSQQVDGENPNLHINSEDVMLCVLPLFHIYSLNVVLFCSLRVGAAVLIMHKFDMVPFLELVQKYKVTIATLVPPIMLAIAKTPAVGSYDLSSVRIIISGAAPLGKELADAVKIKFPNAKIGQGYGLTEAAPVISMCLGFAKDPFDFNSGSGGTVVRNAELKIVDTETGASLGRNQRGEICIRSDQVFKGYLNDPDSTKKTIDEEGWLHTGDIGYVDSNDALFIVDRLKELIKYKGFQVAPAELEALLLNHPDISDAAVVPMKDEEAGEVPVAFVVRANGSAIVENEIKQFVAKQVIFYKRIKRVIFVDVIPKSPSGKILRKDLRARLGAGILN